MERIASGLVRKRRTVVNAWAKEIRRANRRTFHVLILERSKFFFDSTDLPLQHTEVFGRNTSCFGPPQQKLEHPQSGRRFAPMSYSAFRALVVTAVLLCNPFVRAQNASPTHAPRPKLFHPANWDPSPQEVSAAYLTVEVGWNTDLEMRNNLSSRELTISSFSEPPSGREVVISLRLLKSH